MARLSLSRWVGIMLKEFIQLKRDRLTFGMIIGIPVMQLILFGFAINSDPKQLPTAVLAADHGIYERTLLWALKNSGYFRIERVVSGEQEAEGLLARGEVQFVVTVPENFSRKIARGERPALLVEADATDPSATGNAVAALSTIARSALARDLQGTLGRLNPAADPVELRVHRRYNPEGATQYNIVPGLMGVILTMTMILMTGLAMTRERERGTFENLLATPALPIEVMTGKIVPYIMIGLIQVTIVIAAARLIFGVPLLGSVPLLYLCVLLFIAANLTLGITFSSIARNQLQAMQMTFFFFLPSMLLSGFMFPFRGMPDWAQALGSILPLTHFLHLVRGVMLKGNSFVELWPSMWPILAFMLAMIGLGLLVYRRTLDRRIEFNATYSPPNLALSIVALVTGANQGLGFAMVEALCQALPPGAAIYLAARDAGRGTAAVADLAARRRAAVFLPLDVSSDESVAQAAAAIRARHGGIDIVISNAAARITRDRPQAEQVAGFVDTNNHGTYRIIRAFQPLLRDNSRFLVVASSFGSLTRLPAHLHPFFDVTSKTLEDIETLMDDYVRLVQSGRDLEQGWPEWMNVASKVGQVASTKIMARAMRAEAQARGILVNAVCPGLVDTAASRPWFDDMSAAQSPGVAAVDPVWLALRPPGTTAPYGELVRHREVFPWQ